MVMVNMTKDTVESGDMMGFVALFTDGFIVLRFNRLVSICVGREDTTEGFVSGRT